MIDLLPACWCLVFVVCYMGSVVCCVVWCLLCVGFVRGCVLLCVAVRCAVFVVRLLLFVGVRCSLFVICCLLSVACCVLFDVRN